MKKFQFNSINDILLGSAINILFSAQPLFSPWIIISPNQTIFTRRNSKKHLLKVFFFEYVPFVNIEVTFSELLCYCFSIWHSFFYLRHSSCCPFSAFKKYNPAHINVWIAYLKMQLKSFTWTSTVFALEIIKSP